MLVVLSGGAGGAGSIPAACACHARSGSACDFSAAGVPCPPWMSFAGPRQGAEPCPSPGCSQRSQGPEGSFSPFPPSPSAPSIPLSPLSEPGPSRAPCPHHAGAGTGTRAQGRQPGSCLGWGLPVPARHLPLAPETVQPSGFNPPRQRLQQPPHRRRRSRSACPCPRRPRPWPPHRPRAHRPRCHSSALRGLRRRGQRARELPWHALRGEHGGARQPPTCLRAAGQARKSQRFLRFPGPGAFSSGTGWPQPNRGVPPWPPPSRLAREGRGQGSAVHPLAAAQAPARRAGRCPAGPGGITASPGPGHRGLLGGWPPGRPPAASPACAQLVGRVPAACSQGC